MVYGYFMTGSLLCTKTCSNYYVYFTKNKYFTYSKNKNKGGAKKSK